MLVGIVGAARTLRGAARSAAGAAGSLSAVGRRRNVHDRGEVPLGELDEVRQGHRTRGLGCFRRWRLLFFGAEENDRKRSDPGVAPVAHAKRGVRRQIFRKLHARYFVEPRSAVLLGHAPAEQADLSRLLQQLRQQARLMLFEVRDEGNDFVPDKLLCGPANEFLIVRQIRG